MWMKGFTAVFFCDCVCVRRHIWSIMYNPLTRAVGGMPFPIWVLTHIIIVPAGTVEPIYCIDNCIATLLVLGAVSPASLLIQVSQ